VERGAASVDYCTRRGKQRMGRRLKVEMGGETKRRTCSDSIRAFRISSLLFEIGIRSSPSLLISSSDSEIENPRVGYEMWLDDSRVQELSHITR